MIHLVKKDLIIHKFGWFIYFAMLAFFVFVDRNDTEFIIALMSAIVTVYVFYFDEHANGHKLWNALPFTRKEIVSARYIILMINTVIISGAFIAMKLIIQGGSVQLTWQEIVGGSILVIICSAWFFPVLYWFSQSNRIFLCFVVYIASVVIGVYLLSDLFRSKTGSLVGSPIWHGTMLLNLGLLAICLYFVSWVISIIIYNKKEII